MYFSSDFEKLFIRNKAEIMPYGESIHSFCIRNKVPYNLFDRWYIDTRHQIVTIQVETFPEMASRQEVSPPPFLKQTQIENPVLWGL